MAYEFTFTPRFQKHFKTVLIVEAAYLKKRHAVFLHSLLCNQSFAATDSLFFAPCLQQAIENLSEFFMRIWKC